MSDTPNLMTHERIMTGEEYVSYSDYLKLQRERDDYMERCRTALSERDSWRLRAEQKYAMRRELEELLGVDQKDASDEQFQKGLDSLKNIIGERNEAIQRRMETILQCELLEKELDKAREEVNHYRDKLDLLPIKWDI
jgi:hypothetical protein